ncbi:MAG: hypothetical protein ACOYJ8_03500 [Patescibacteria group bacterium]|jgi:GGDEF domain-containing protein
MVELTGEIPVRQENLINNPQLGERINLYLSEPTPPQAGFLNRKEWQQKLEKSLLSEKNTLVIFADIAGAGKLGEEINTRVAQFIADISFWQGEQIAKGRQAQAQARQAGSDEFLVFAQTNSQAEAQKSINQLTENLNFNRDRNQVHLGAAFIPGGTRVNLSSALRGADIALKTAKEANKDENRTKDSNPKLLIFNNVRKAEDPIAAIDNTPIAEEDFSTRTTTFPQEVVTENSVVQLRQNLDPNKPITILSPKQMKKINEAGMSRGDEVLENIACQLATQLKEERPQEEVKIYKIGPNFVFRGTINQKSLEAINHHAPHGLEWFSAKLDKQS